MNKNLIASELLKLAKSLTASSTFKSTAYAAEVYGEHFNCKASFKGTNITVPIGKGIEVVIDMNPTGVDDEGEVRFFSARLTEKSQREFEKIKG